MNTLNDLIERVARTQYGFTDILRAANEVAATILPRRAFAWPST